MTASVTLDAAVYGALQAELDALRARSRASEARFERLTANLPGVVYQATLGLDGTLTFSYASSGTDELFGVPPAAIAQVVPMVHPDDRASLKAIHRQSQAHLTDVDWEGRIQVPDGTTKWIQLRARPARQTDGTTLWDGLAIDISDRRAAADALRQSAQFLQSVLDAIPVVVFVKRAEDLAYDALNVAAARAMGHDSIDPILDKTDFDFFPPAIAADFAATDRRILNEGTLQEIPEETVVTPTGTRFYRTLKVPLYQDGRPTHLLGVAQDITDRRWAERNWHQQRSLLNSLVKNAPIGIVIFDRQYRFLQVNQAIADMDGWTIGDHDGKVLRDIAPDLADVLEPILQRILETGEPVNNLELEGELATAPGKRRSWLASYFPIGFGDGRVESIGGIVVETTHQRQVETTLRDLNDRYEKLASNLPGVVYHFRRRPEDPLGEFVYISPAVQDLYQLEPAAVQADAGLMWSRVHPDDAAAFEASIEQAVATDGNWSHEHRLVLDDGTVRWIQGTARMQLQPDGTLLSDGILLDVTDRRSSDEALQALSDRLQRLANSVPGMMYQYRMAGPEDELGEFLYLSPGCRDLYGIEPATGTANPLAIWGRAHPDDLIRVHRSITEAVIHRCQWDCEYRITTVDGEVKWVQAAARPRFFEDGSSLWDGLIIDITARKLAETALAQEQEFVRVVIESVSDAVVACDGAGNLKLFNRAARQWHSCDPRSLPPEEWSEHYDLRTGDGSRPLAVEEIPLLRAFEGESVRGAQIAIAVPNTPLRMLVTNADPLYDRDGQKIGAVAVMHDVTERRRNEAARRKLTRNLQEAQRIAHIGNWELDPKTGQIHWSDEIFRIFGRDRDAGPPDLDTLRTYYHPEDWPALVGGLERCIATGESYDLELRIIHGQTGEIRYVQNRGEASHGRDGQLQRAFGVAMDVTHRRQAENQLYESQQLLLLVLNTIPQAVFWKDRNSIYLGCNRAFAEFVELPSARDVIGKTDHDLNIPPDAADSYYRMDQEVMAHDLPIRRGTTTLPLPDGTTCHLEFNKLPLHDRAGKVVGILGSFEDVTERRLAEQTLRSSEAALRQKAADLEAALEELQRTQNQLVQSEKMSSLGQLVAGVAHEINNPVNFIFGNLSHANDYAQQLLEVVAAYQTRLPDPDDELADLIDAVDLDFLIEDLPKLLESMRVGAQRIREIVVSLRNFSRLDEAAYKAVDLHEGIDSTLLILQNRLKPRFDHPGIHVSKKYGELPLVECFAGQLNQVFMNILSNAIDALEERDRGQPFDVLQQHPSTIEITTEPLGDDWLRVAIADNGPGMPLDVQQRLFDPFFTTKPVGKGTGLGMSISYQIVTERHHGRIECQSSAEEGTRFVIEIPIQQPGSYS